MVFDGRATGTEIPRSLFHLARRISSTDLGSELAIGIFGNTIDMSI
jgi:hypothetical protein